MANKKKARKRPYVPPQRAGAPSGNGGEDGGSREKEKKTAESTPAISEKAADRRERKSEVREQKERELRRYQRNHFLSRVLVAVVIIALVGGGIGYLVYSRTKDTRAAQELIAQASVEAKAAGCTPVETTEPYDPEDSDRSHVTDFPALDTYSTTPPASGPHAGVTLRAGAYDEAPAIGEALHSLEHGAVIIWYAPDADPKELAEIKALVGENQDHTIMAPYDYPNEGKTGTLPDGKQMALVSWHRLQVCNEPSKAVVAEFMSKYREPTFGGGEYQGEAPEAGVLI